MADTAKDAKLLQYLNEAYGKERELETALQAHIGMTTKKPYAKRLGSTSPRRRITAASSNGASRRSAARAPRRSSP